MNKRGELLVGNVIFIILNLVFLAILVVFILSKGNGISSLEESYAKQIALTIDSAKPGMKIVLDMKDAMDSSEWFKENYFDSVKISGNLVTVKLSEDSSYSYSFFNDVKISKDVYPEGQLIIFVGGENA